MDKQNIRQNPIWIHRQSRLPCEADGDACGKVLAWHVFQGAMLVSWQRYPHNCFHAYWTPLAALDGTPWLRAREKPPSQADADAQNCVLVLDRNGETSVTGYRQFDWNSSLTHWKPLPAPPDDAKALRQRF